MRDEARMVEARIIPHRCSACGSPVRVLVPDIPEERKVIEAAKALTNEPHTIEAFCVAVEALLAAEKGEE